MAIDASLFTAEKLIDALLHDSSGNRDRWRRNAEIIPAYVPPGVRDRRDPIVAVRYQYGDGAHEKVFLRYSKGPLQGHSWDIYGDDYQTPELALMALLEAPVPPQLLVKSVWGKP